MVALLLFLVVMSSPMRSTSIPRHRPAPSQEVGGPSFVSVGQAADEAGAELLCRRDRAKGSLRLARHVIRALDRGQPVDPHVINAALDAIEELQVSLQ